MHHDARRNDMPYTLKQAAEATGKSKPTILRAIQSNKVSATRDEVTNGWLIEPAELHRVYPTVTEKVLRNTQMTHDVMPNELTALRRELEIRDERLEALQQERQRERQDTQNTIDDLRKRLDREGEERRKLTAILTDQRAQTMITPPPEASPAAAPTEATPRRSLWPWSRRR